MPDAVIVSTARTAIGTSFKGSLLDVDAFELGTLAVAEAVRRSGVDPELVDDVVLGELLYGGGDIARYAAIEAGLVHAPGVAQNRHCASGLSAIQSAAASIRSGMDNVVVAGGAHSSSTSPRTSRRVLGADDWEEWNSPSHRETPTHPTATCRSPWAGTPPSKANVTREEMDAWAFRSHQRAVAAIDAGSVRR